MGAVYVTGDIARHLCAAFQMKVMDEMRPTRQRVEGSVVARGGRWGRAIGLVVSDDFNAVVVMRVLWEDASSVVPVIDCCRKSSRATFRRVADYHMTVAVSW